MGMTRLPALVWISAATLLAQNVTTGGYSNERTNADLRESTLTPANVRPSKFGKLFTLSVDGQVYAQPLYQHGLNIAGKGVHNVLFAVTMHNTVYAFDADAPDAPLWTANLGPSIDTTTYSSDSGDYQDILPENGILSTPVIDAVNGILYAVAGTVENGHYLYRLHALNTSTGTETAGGPSLITASVPGVGDNSTAGNVAFDPAQHLQRSALLLSAGKIYIAFGSHGDASPYHGWIMAYDAANIAKQTAVFNATPNGAGGAFWQSGRGLTADTDGTVYAVSSNGDTDEDTNFSSNVLTLDASSLAVRDWFAPSDFAVLNDSDDDLGACGAVLIPGTNYLVTGGKEGIVYLLDKTQLGHTTTTDSQILQSFSGGDFGIFNLAVWPRPDGTLLYAHPANAPVKSWKLSGNTFSAAPVAQSLTGFNVPYQGMTLSANGTQSGTGLLWILASGGYPLPAPGMLRVYDAETLEEVWNSSIDPADVVGPYVKFVNPTVADGKVFVPSLSNSIVVYGLKSVAPSAPAVTAVVNAADYSNGPVAPGEIVAVYGQNLGPKDYVTGNFDGFGNLDRQLFGTLITFNNVPAPLIYTSAGVASVVVPYEVGTASTVTVQATVNGVAASPVTVPLAASAPAVFSADASGRGPGAILNQDYSLNTAQAPAEAGSIIVIYGTGGGALAGDAATGTIVTDAELQVQPVSVTIGGVSAEVLYAGNAGGEVAGAMQLNVRVPAGIHGAVPVVVTVGGKASQGLATVSVR